MKVSSSSAVVSAPSLTRFQLEPTPCFYPPFYLCLYLLIISVCPISSCLNNLLIISVSIVLRRTKRAVLQCKILK